MKPTRKFRFSLFASAAVLVLIVAGGTLAHTPLASAASGLAAQVNREGPVQVRVKPRSLAPDAKLWEFEVAFNTHSVPIDGDPAKFSVLVDTNGKTHAAIAWQGDPPGGHHRKGVLQFKPLASEKAVELRINGVAGVATRSFRWQR